jgi:hypothetical protein
MTATSKIKNAESQDDRISPKPYTDSNHRANNLVARKNLTKMHFSLFATAIVLFATVSADRSIVVLFNNGAADSTSGSCSSTDLVKTNAVITASSLNSNYARRNLRAPIEDLNDMTE